IRDNEEAAASVGVRVLANKRVIFVLAAAGCALAGALWLATATTFQPRSYFGIQWTAYMIFMVLVGGLGRFEGPILGAIIFFLIESWFGATGGWYLIGLGAPVPVCFLCPSSPSRRRGVCFRCSCRRASGVWSKTASRFACCRSAIPLKARIKK